MSVLPLLGRNTVALAFKRRHESPFMRHLARQTIRDAKLWRDRLGPLPACPLHGAGFICQHDIDVDYSDEFA